MEIASLLQAIETQPWAINPLAVRPMVQAIVNVAQNPPTEEQAKKLTTSQDRSIAKRGSMAAIPIHGPMFQRVGFIGQLLGFTGSEQVRAQIEAAADDPTYSAILLHVDSPGGSVYGTRELADAVRAAREKKPVIAQVDSVAASAAYWVAAQATEIAVTPGGDVGSVGVYAVHQDVSKALEASGVDVTVISAGKYKTDGNPYEPLSEEAKTWMQSRADMAYRDFVAAVAEGRGVDRSDVEANYGQGRVVGAKAALQSGMVDRIATTTQTISRFTAAQQQGRNKRQRAATYVAVSQRQTEIGQ